MEIWCCAGSVLCVCDYGAIRYSVGGDFLYCFRGCVIRMVLVPSEGVCRIEEYMG